MSEQPAGPVTLEQAVELVACPFCKQPRGQQCQTPGKRLAPVHSPRYEAAKAYRREAAKLEAWNRGCSPDAEPPTL
jgi:hypothetical protein